jgi:hypothetical protein
MRLRRSLSWAFVALNAIRYTPMRALASARFVANLAFVAYVALVPVSNATNAPALLQQLNLVLQLYWLQSQS